MRALVICDFNLTRTEDVRLMRDYARARYGLPTVLIRNRPTVFERTLGDHVIDADPLAEGFAATAAAALADQGLEPVAVLPFSDNGVRSGAELAARLGLRHDSAELAQNAFSKLSYRQAEAAAAELWRAQGVMVPASAMIRSREELEKFARRCPIGFVLKPSCEGNNRGVIRLGPGDDLAAALEEVSPYLEGGLIAEELITLPSEASFDGVGHLNFITEKVSVTDRYPVERGQVVPARFSAPLAEAVRGAGRVANLIAGQKVGPFHNEIKFDSLTGETAVIEPNRRPAGMRIWHLAEKVYGMNFFELWIDQLVTGRLPAALPAPRGRAAIRMLPAPCDGVFSYEGRASEASSEIFRQVLAEMDPLPPGVEWLGFQLNAGSGTSVSSIQRDNAAFIAQVSAFSPNGGPDVQGLLDEFEHAWIRVAQGLVAVAALEAV